MRHNSGRFDISATRIGAAGGSSGGHLVSLALTGEGDPDDQDPVNRESARVQRVVAERPPWISCAWAIETVSGFMGMIVRGEAGGPYGVEQQTYREASPLNLVSSSTVPFLLIAGTKDTAVPPEQAELMHAALKAAGVPAEVLWIEGAGHGPDFPGAVIPSGLPRRHGALVQQAPARKS